MVFNLFKKYSSNKQPTHKDKKVRKVKLKKFAYHPKIILAWAKAIEGNADLLKFLNKNGYEELVVAAHAIKLKEESRDWLMKNGYPHVMAMINAGEGNQQALKWLKLNEYTLFYNMALAIDGENEGFIWIRKHATPDIFMLTQSIKRVKDEIEEDNNDIHKRSKS